MRWPPNIEKKKKIIKHFFIKNHKLKLYNRKPAPNSNYEIHTLKGWSRHQIDKMGLAPPLPQSPSG